MGVRKMSSTNYEEIFSYDLLRNMFYFNGKCSIDASNEQISQLFHDWLGNNKDFRINLSKLSDDEIKNYISDIADQIETLKNKSIEEVFYPFDSIKLSLRTILLKKQANEKKPESILEQVIENYKERNAKQLTPLTFNDFMAKNDKKEYYVKQMFAKGTINMIFSPPKQMKTFVSYYLALCLATGKSFLNQKTKKVPICYFDWENPVSDIQNRVKGICAGMDFDCNSMENFYFFNRQPTLLRVNGRDSFVLEDIRNELIEFVKANEIKVIFFDTLRRLGNFDENDSGAINTIKSELFDPLIRASNVCIIFLHHTGKEGNRYRGSVDIEGILDASFKIVKRHKEDEIKIDMVCDARRNNEIEKLSALVEIENSSFEDEEGEMLEIIDSVKFMRLETEEDEEKGGDYGRYRRFFIESLKVGEKYKNQDLLNIIEYNFGKKRGTALKIIRWFVDNNILQEYGEPKSKKKYYVINPVYGDTSDTIKIDEIEKYFKEHFRSNDLVDIELLKKKFNEQFFSLVTNKWVQKGWINTARAGYLQVTDLYRAENPITEVICEEVDLK